MKVKRYQLRWEWIFGRKRGAPSERFVLDD